jgi:hypothetical protein
MSATAELCDQCGAVATVKVTLRSQKALFFCGHDYQKNLPALNDVFDKLEVKDSFVAEQVSLSV